MATVMKTPGVYIVEKDAFPSSVVEVATAVPAFIGYTEMIADNGKSLVNKPRRLSSLTEFEKFFGGAPKLSFTLSTEKTDPVPDDPVPAGPTDPVASLKDGTKYYLSRIGKRYHLYYSMKSFFQNGGGPCYVVTVGEYDYAAPLDAEALMNAIEPLKKEQEPTMVVIPDSVLLGPDGHANVMAASIKHCAEMMSRITILDVFRGHEERTNVKDTDCIMKFREAVGINDLKWATAYYPWVDTSIVGPTGVTYDTFDKAGREALAELLTKHLGLPATPEKPRDIQQAELIAKISDDGLIEADDDSDEVEEKKRGERETLNNGLLTLQLFKDVLKVVQEEVNLLPPSGTMAGVYSDVDNKRGVWKAPANVSLAGVVKPHVNLTHEEQEDLNVPVTGQSVNAIRSFIGEGTLVWGGRTLDGNSLDWRYINVRRTLIMIEQSIKLATKAYVFEANDANTWITIKSMIRNFLTGIWKRGGLAGASPDDAFSVHVGLGETMTDEDILEGILRVTVLLAPTRPAEFIEVTFQQQQQKS